MSSDLPRVEGEDPRPRRLLLPSDPLAGRLGPIQRLPRRNFLIRTGVGNGFHGGQPCLGSRRILPCRRFGGVPDEGKALAGLAFVHDERRQAAQHVHGQQGFLSALGVVHREPVVTPRRVEVVGVPVQPSRQPGDLTERGGHGLDTARILQLGPHAGRHPQMGQHRFGELG